MLTTIVCAHPYEKSYNRAILDTVIKSLAAKDREYALIDLYEDNFDPVLTKKELAVYGTGKFISPLVGKYNKILDDTERMILIFPIWWYDFPAIMKGFFDKVMLPGSAYNSTDKGLAAVRDIKETLIITTSAAATDALVNKLGDTVNRMMIDTVFKAVGLNGARWENLGAVGKSTFGERMDFLAKISSIV
ncbi:NAD(P)H-dependent oxidoreductase [Cloacibacillus evryensis]|uniref:NAD(P)H-dependent oxidoreductase n=1 Tax=Cloacibacillus evryensis TaxID=508460 RepID=UPI002420066B|nr:NAD(P)H-dependent oxidoreductase [Cloacibacillus evryensis]